MGLGVSAAGAAPANPTTTLAPEAVDLVVDQPQNFGEMRAGVQGHHSPGVLEMIPVAWGGTVTFALPPLLAPTGPGLEASLYSKADHMSLETRTYSTDPAVSADPLVVTDLGGSTYRVDLPADDGVNGPAARLSLTNLAPTPGSWSTLLGTPSWELEFSAGAPAAVTLTSVTSATSVLGCSTTASPTCTVVPVTAGTAMDVVLPASSRVTELGIPDLGVSDFSLEDLPGSDLIAQARIQLDPTLSADRRTATMTIPATTKPGRYQLRSVAGGGVGQVLSTTFSVVEVVAPAVNPGLRSETGGDTGPSVLLPVLLGSVGALAVGGAVRSRRRSVVQG
ncbi:hypothetical protein O2V63_04670 [Modestobacter sp. VKM Ac-2977]|uniref:hypothetical protein n=1 Tax=Modestobacter sp. VKM Ac-2977 TaxID=3004131 RepID=UPI0022AA0E66|nr:hypothetical protein [Modestobacter sp. VKM Ac-2977]MCZ2819620.1 hypothetical protein [Modestobacter sp. VKM Ac-2977]